jgi:hypothetical protein
METNSEWLMPQPRPGDTVLFSTDYLHFSNPTIGWVIREPGDSTISILTFTETGFVQRHSVHHKDDPALLGDHGWHELGCWDFAPMTRDLRDLMAPPASKKVTEKVTSGRETAAK